MSPNTHTCVVHPNQTNPKVVKQMMPFKNKANTWSTTTYGFFAVPSQVATHHKSQLLWFIFISYSTMNMCMENHRELWSWIFQKKSVAVLKPQFLWMAIVIRFWIGGAVAFGGWFCVDGGSKKNREERASILRFNFKLGSG
jgi:hypothetical protein